jgi:hypothetical protein
MQTAYDAHLSRTNRQLSGKDKASDSIPMNLSTP